MLISFYKFHGTGNDFIIINKIKSQNIDLNTDIIKQLCNRNFGIGADGLMTMLPSNNYDFEMKYYNSDGKEGSMCGNGGRCIVAYAKMVNIIKDKTTFLASDGVHKAIIDENNIVKLKMIDVIEIKKYDDGYFLDTGSPHFVQFTNNLDNINIEKTGKDLRFDKRFAPSGTNVNFAEIKNDYILFKTYERGVEKETLSCGTGAVATALASVVQYENIPKSVNLQAKGGKLNIYFSKTEQNSFANIWLEGETKFVFNGEIS